MGQPGSVIDRTAAFPRGIAFPQGPIEIVLGAADGVNEGKSLSEACGYGR